MTMRKLSVPAAVRPALVTGLAFGFAIAAFGLMAVVIACAITGLLLLVATVVNTVIQARRRASAPPVGADTEQDIAQDIAQDEDTAHGGAVT